MQGYKVKEKTAIVSHSAALYPQFQNSVGTMKPVETKSWIDQTLKKISM